jgi:hypothetical protein
VSTILGRRLRAAALLVAIAAATACQEKLTSPADCPEICPGGQPQTVDTVLTAVANQDSSFGSYVERGGGLALLASNGLDGAQDRPIVRFLARSDSLILRDTLRAFTVDSVALTLGVIARDSTAKNLRLLVYRLPSTIDSTTGFAEVESQLTPANLIDSVAVPDTMTQGTLRILLAGAALDRLGLPLGGDSVLAVGVRLSSATSTGVRVGSAGAGTLAPAFVSYTRVEIADTALQRQTISRGPTYASFVSQSALAVDPLALVVGGSPSKRALIRFALPPRIRDSATIVRATLELVPTVPVPGLPNDPATIEVRTVLSDLGAKSPTVANRSGTAQLAAGQADTVRVDVVSLVRLWQGVNARPGALFVAILPQFEAGTFTQPVFGSTRTAAGAPRLRITYLLPFPFERP